MSDKERELLREMASGLEEIKTFIENSQWLRGDESDPMLERALRSIEYHQSLLPCCEHEDAAHWPLPPGLCSYPNCACRGLDQVTVK